MKGTIVNYRQGRHTQNPKHMIVRVEGVDERGEAAKLRGKEVVWKSPSGKELRGEVAAAHGNSGAVRVIFPKGLPGQAVGSEVRID